MGTARKMYVVVDTKVGPIRVNPCPSCGALATLRPSDHADDVHEVDIEHEETCAFMDELEANAER